MVYHEEFVKRPCVCRDCKNVHYREVPRCQSGIPHPMGAEEGDGIARYYFDKQLQCEHEAGHKGHHRGRFDNMRWKDWTDKEAVPA